MKEVYNISYHHSNAMAVMDLTNSQFYVELLLYIRMGILYRLFKKYV